MFDPTTQAEYLLGLNRALHSRDYKELETVLNAIDLKSIAAERFPVLHRLYSNVCPDARCQSDALRCTELLIQAGADINLKVLNGDVPLYLAVKNQWHDSAGFLLAHGAETADLLNESSSSPQRVWWKSLLRWLFNKQEMTLATYIVLNAPDVFLNHLNKSVWLNLENEKMRINFNSLVQCPRPPAIIKPESSIYASEPPNLYENKEMPSTKLLDFQESKFLYHISFQSDADSRIFEHPVVKYFVRVKYLQLRPQLIVSSILHWISVIFFTAFIIMAYAVECQYDDSRDAEGTEPEDDNNCRLEAMHQWLAGALVLIWVSLIIPDIVGLCIFRLNYITMFTVPWIVLYTLWLVVLWPALDLDDTQLVPDRYPYAAVTLFLVWGLLILQMSKLEKLALYCEMFIRVTVRIVLLSMLFVPLFIGFILSLVIMGSDLQTKVSDMVALFSQIVGGPDFESIFQDRDTDTKAYMAIAVIIYIAFVLLLCIVFINFLLALTTGDLPALWSQAQKGKIQTWIQQVYLYERTPGLRLMQFTAHKQEAIRRLAERDFFHDVDWKKHPNELLNELKKIATLTVTVRGCESHQNDSRNISEHLNSNNKDILAEIAQMQEALKLISSQVNKGI